MKPCSIVLLLFLVMLHSGSGKGITSSKVHGGVHHRKPGKKDVTGSRKSIPQYGNGGSVDDDGCVRYTHSNALFDETISIPVMKWFETPSLVSFGAACTSDRALGLESGVITDQQMTASSMWDINHHPSFGRLNIPASPQKAGGWGSRINNLNQWLQVDFGRTANITGVATQGREDYDQRVGSYHIKYSQDGSNFVTYTEDGASKLFTGNTDRNTVVTHELLHPIIARYVRINPRTWEGLIVMRAEFYGCILSERYQVLGRVVHMDSIRERLVAKNVNLGESQEQINNIQLEILADTVYIQGDIKLHGIANLTMFTRHIVSAAESRLDLSAPSLTQSFSADAGAYADGGESGAKGATVDIFTDVSTGHLNILSSGGNGNRGQNGGRGETGDAYTTEAASRGQPDCNDGAVWRNSRYHPAGRYIESCNENIGGRRGHAGGTGGDGGVAGKPGNGGHAGLQTLHINRANGNLEMRSCRGIRGGAAQVGPGGYGGPGGPGGLGVSCTYYSEDLPRARINNYITRCDVGDPGPRGPQGSTGPIGPPGQAPSFSPHDGSVESAFLDTTSLLPEDKQMYPLVLLTLMKRYAEDLIWVNNTVDGGRVLRFLITLTGTREDASAIRKIAKRKLGFLHKEGFDRFGRNMLFAPRIRWESLKQQVLSIAQHAQAYEDTYNDIQSNIEQQDNLRVVQEAIRGTADVQIRAEKLRLEMARVGAISEKRILVSAIQSLEENMDEYMNTVGEMFPDIYESATFEPDKLFAVLQGITGFVSGIAGRDPFATIGAAIDLAGSLSGGCNVGTLQENLDSIEQWLTFGREYAALEDSSDLDFDLIEITSIPEVMKANLEINKEGLTADLVCLLEERLDVVDRANFEEQINRFFIAGAARIDLIANVIQLDNDIGGFNFDIPVLEETLREIDVISNSSTDTPITEDIQLVFLDDLLTAYQQMETNFTKHLYNMYKAFEFRVLWNVEDRMITYLRRASTTAPITGRLRGVLELTQAVQEIDEVEFAAQSCFTNIPYTTHFSKWNFDNLTHQTMFEELHGGETKFTIRIADSTCTWCRNIRMLKMYVELYGSGSDQIGTYPATVFLKLRHMSGSYFRDGNDVNNIREYRQPIGLMRTFRFNRIATTDSVRCNEARAQRNQNTLFCMEEDDDRWQEMCCNFLSNSNCDESLLGGEECRSPFGIYELSMPIDDQAPCSADPQGITDRNCRDFDRTMFTHMHVWVQYMYWSNTYPTGPDDSDCTPGADIKSHIMVEGTKKQ